MATTTTITQPSPILEGSLTSFLKHLDKLQAGSVPTGFAGIDTSKYAPQVAAQDALQTGAATAAAGLGSLVGAGAGTGAGSIAEYMSPYQQQVIDAQMQEFDRQAAINRQGIQDSAIQAGAFG